MQRREFLTTATALLGALAAAGFLGPEARAEAWNKAAFDARSLDELFKVLGEGGAAESPDVAIVAPDIAENGAVVPLNVSSAAAKTDAIAVVVEKNPTLLSAIFFFPQGTLPEVQTRVKMAMTSNVYAIARCEGGLRYAAKEIKVTLGGCGG